MSTSTQPEHVQRTNPEPVTVDAVGTINEYLSRADWRVNANANQGYSLGGMILNTSGKVIANYWLTQVYGAAADQAHREGDLHIHDLRRTLGSWLASSGTSLPIIGRVLNHKTPEATKVYARLIVAPVRNAMEEATAAMRKIGEQ